MSRIGYAPINMPQGVTVSTDASSNEVVVKGAKGELKQELRGNISLEVKENEVLVKRVSDSREDRAMHGLYRALINNMVIGVSQGYEKKLELVGVGYRAELKQNVLDLMLGFSHHIFFVLPQEVQAEVESKKGSNPIITLKSHDKQLLGQIGAKIRSLRKPEPYKGKGIRFVGEHIRRKTGKAVAKAK